MRAGLVLGAVWATKKSPALTGQSLLRVRCGETEYLAADLVGAGPGDRVILAFGAAARAGRPDVPVDALPPYGCGVPFTGSERHWQSQVLQQ